MPTAKTFDVLIVDDHPAYRAGVHVLLEYDPQIGSITEAATVADALAAAETRSFDLAIVDVVLPETGGASLVRQLARRLPACRMLALSMIDEPIRIAEMLRAGAHGYALNSQPVDDLRDRMLRLLVDVEHHLQRRRDLAWDEVELELGGSE